MEQIQQDHLADMDLQVDSEVRQHLNDSAKWTKFIAISIFILCGLILLFAVVGMSAIMGVMNKYSGGRGSFMAEFPVKAVIAVLIFLVVIVAIVYYFLLNFSLKIKSALLNEDVDSFNKGLSSLKTFFIITTVFSILSLISSIATLF